MFNAAFWWTIAGLALMISEFAVPGLILFFFGIGALLTALLAWVTPIGIEGQIAVERGGHALHQQLVAEILRTPEAWRVEGPVAPVCEAADLASLPTPVGVSA